MKVPEFMPMLGWGCHESPEEGACVMEMVSILAGGKFTDQPECSLHTITCFAQRVNDMLPDEERHLLVPLIPRLIGTRTGDHEQNEKAERHLTNWLFGDDFTVRGVIDNMSPVEKVQALSNFLDEYDRITGRVTEPATKEMSSIPERVLV